MLTRSRQSVLKSSPLDNDAALIVWIPFAGAAGIDFSGKQNNAVAVSTPVFTPSEMGDSFAMSAGNYFQVTTLGAANPIATNAVTAACWLKPNATSRGDLISVWGGAGSGTDQFDLLYGLTAGKPQFFTVAGGLQNSGVGSTAMTAGLRYHVAGTFDGTNVAVYLNGKLEATAVHAGTLGSGASNPIQIGTSTSSNTANGAMADVRVYNRALSAAEINALYNQNIARLSLSPDEWEMPILPPAAASSFLAAWARGSNLPVLGTGTY